MDKLSDEQRRQWNVDGYLVVEQALTSEEVGFFCEELDRIRQLPGFEPDPAPELPMGHYSWAAHTKDLDAGGYMDRRDLLPYHHSFVDLIDRPGIFDLIVDIMGPNLLFSMSQAIVRPKNEKFPGYTHTDGGEALREIRVTESSRPLAMKVIYLLTDVTERDSGNFTVFPGSHMRPFPLPGEEGPAVFPTSPGSHQLTARAGDAIMFPHALWHGPSANLLGTSRKTLLYNYCQLFMRCYDFEVPPEIMERCTPRQRRLLGNLGYDFRPGSYFYVPGDQKQVIEGA